MAELTHIFAKLIANYAKTGVESLSTFIVLRSFGYSQHLFTQMSEVLKPHEIEHLKNNKYVIGKSELDSVFICDVTIKDAKYTAVIYDFEELYAPIWVWGLFRR